MTEEIFQFAAKDPGQHIFGKKRGVNDVVYTPHDLAKSIIQHFKPSGRQLDPCRGDGAFFDQMEGDKDWCELAKGKDFLAYDKPLDWIISNPPWSSSAYRDIAKHAFHLSENVVFLIRLHNAIGTYARHRAYLDAGHGLKEILVVPWPDTWRQEGFILAAFHWQRGWIGGTTWSYESKHSRYSEISGTSAVGLLFAADQVPL